MFRDLLRLFEFLLDRAQTAKDFDQAQHVIDTVRGAISTHLASTPFIFRKAGPSPFLRELVIPCSRTGFVALYEIEDAEHVNVLATRHQREDDDH